MPTMIQILKGSSAGACEPSVGTGEDERSVGDGESMPSGERIGEGEGEGDGEGEGESAGGAGLG